MMRLPTSNTLKFSSHSINKAVKNDNNDTEKYSNRNKTITIRTIKTNKANRIIEKQKPSTANNIKNNIQYNHNTHDIENNRTISKASFLDKEYITELKLEGAHFKESQKDRIPKMMYEFNNISTDPVTLIQEKLRKGVIDYTELPDLNDLFSEPSNFERIFSNFTNKKPKTRILNKKKDKKFDFNTILNNKEEMLLVDPDDSIEKLKFDEEKVKKLDYWEKEYLDVHNKDIINSNTNNYTNNNSKKCFTTEIEAAKLMSSIRNNLSKLNLDKDSNLNAFYKQNETELSIILMMNINLSKKKFNFDVFKKANDHVDTYANNKINSGNNTINSEDNTKISGVYNDLVGSISNNKNSKVIITKEQIMAKLREKKYIYDRFKVENLLTNDELKDLKRRFNYEGELTTEDKMIKKGNKLIRNLYDKSERNSVSYNKSSYHNDNNENVSNSGCIGNNNEYDIIISKTHKNNSSTIDNKDDIKYNFLNNAFSPNSSIAFSPISKLKSVVNNMDTNNKRISLDLNNISNSINHVSNNDSNSEVEDKKVKFKLNNNRFIKSSISNSNTGNNINAANHSKHSSLDINSLKTSNKDKIKLKLIAKSRVSNTINNNKPDINNNRLNIISKKKENDDNFDSHLNSNNNTIIYTSQKPSLNNLNTIVEENYNKNDFLLNSNPLYSSLILNNKTNNNFYNRSEYSSTMHRTVTSNDSNNTFFNHKLFKDSISALSQINKRNIDINNVKHQVFVSNKNVNKYIKEKNINSSVKKKENDVKTRDLLRNGNIHTSKNSIYNEKELKTEHHLNKKEHYDKILKTTNLLNPKTSSNSKINLTFHNKLSNSTKTDAHAISKDKKINDDNNSKDDFDKTSKYQMHLKNLELRNTSGMFISQLANKSTVSNIDRVVNDYRNRFIKSFYHFKSYAVVNTEKRENSAEKRYKQQMLNDKEDIYGDLKSKIKHLTVIAKNKDELTNIDENYLKKARFKITDDMAKFSNVDKYRVIIKDRMKLEIANRKELMKLNSKLYEIKFAKERQEKEVNKICHELNLLRGDMLVKIDTVKAKIQKSETKYYEMLKSPFFKLQLENDRKEETTKELKKINKTNKTNQTATTIKEKEINISDNQILSTTNKENNAIKENKDNIIKKAISKDTDIINKDTTPISNNKDSDVEKKEEIRLIDQINYHRQKQEDYINECYEEIEDIKYFYNKKLRNKTGDYDNKKAKANELDSEINILKTELHKFSQEQISYYLHLLLQGYDVRSEGLVWIVKRLIELNTPLDVSLFPKYLDTNQIEYIINLAYSQIEATQLKIVLKALKERQKHMRDFEIDSNMRTTYGSSFYNQTNQTGFFVLNEEINNNNHHLNTITHNDNKTRESGFANLNSFPNLSKDIKSMSQSIGEINHTSNIVINEIKKKLNLRNRRLREQIVSIYENMNQRHHQNDYTRNNLFMEENQQHEDVLIDSIVGELRKKIRLGITSKNDSAFPSLTGVKSDDKSKAFFEEILALRMKIIEFDKEIEEMILNEQKFFKDRYDTLKLINPKHGFQYDLIYSGLFGNGVVI